MKLTELRDKINEALKMNDDYEVKIVAEAFSQNHILDIDDAGIDRDRFNFNLCINVVDMIDSYME